MKYLRSKQLSSSADQEPCYEKVADCQDDEEDDEEETEGVGSMSPSAMSCGSTASSKGTHGLLSSSLSFYTTIHNLILVHKFIHNNNFLTSNDE